MPVEIEIPDDLFTPEELQKLTALLTNVNKEDFPKALQKVVHAALSEYKEMFLGQGLPSRADEIQQHRLFYLIKRFFCGRIPTEAEVSRMFQLTRPRSTSLIRFTMTRFRYSLETEVNNTLREIVRAAKKDKKNKRYTVVIQSENMVNELNLIIAADAPNLDPVSRSPHSAKLYQIAQDSYDVLCKRLGAK